MLSACSSMCLVKMRSRSLRCPKRDFAHSFCATSALAMHAATCAQHADSSFAPQPITSACGIPAGTRMYDIEGGAINIVSILTASVGTLDLVRPGGAHIVGRELTHVAQEPTSRGVDTRDAAIFIVLCCTVQRLVELRRRLVCMRVTAINPTRRSTEGKSARSGCVRMGVQWAHIAPVTVKVAEAERRQASS